jgi:hypothetical protein
MSYTFDGANKLIIITGTATFTAADLYSRWKDWVQTSDNSKYVSAFRSVGGDPIGPGQTVAPYFFLNTTDGWRIRPNESSHELRISGNLYSEDSTLSMFVPTLGAYTVTIVIERSSAAIAVTVGGVDQATVQAALTAQGYTTSRSAKIDNLDVTVSSVGLTSTQQTMLLEMYRLLGLDPTKPLIVTDTSRAVGGGAGISQTITEGPANTFTVQRV